MNKTLTKQANDKHELLLRNQAYKTTLEYCPETCDDIDKLFNTTYFTIVNSKAFSEAQLYEIDKLLRTLSEHVKDNGTRKLRKAFVDYVYTHMY